MPAQTMAPSPVTPAASGQARPTAAATGRPAEIGSEGFGPRIRQIADGGSPQEAADAAWQLQQCRQIELSIESLQRFGNTPEATQHNDIYKRMVEDVQREQRRCQTVTAELDALRPALLLKAMRGGIEGAALDYFFETNKKPGQDPALRQEVLAALRGEADRGSPFAMTQLALADSGQPELERRAYKRASQLINANNAQQQGFLSGFGEKLAQWGLKLDDFHAFRKEPAAPDIDAKVNALLAAHPGWKQRRVLPQPLTRAPASGG